MAHSTNTTSNEKTKMATSGIREGYWFYFNDESVDIAVNGSMWSGRETVEHRFLEAEKKGFFKRLLGGK